jgi:hypothetical protein
MTVKSAIGNVPNVIKPKPVMQQVVSSASLAQLGSSTSSLASTSFADNESSLSAPRPRKKKKSWLGISGYQRAGDPSLPESTEAAPADAANVLLILPEKSIPIARDITIERVSSPHLVEMPPVQEPPENHSVDNPMSSSVPNQSPKDKLTVTSSDVRDTAKVTIVVPISEAVDERYSKISLPIYSYTLAHTSEKCVIDLQVALFLGYKSGRQLLEAFKEQFTKKKPKVLTLNEKKVLETSPVACSILATMLNNGTNPKWLKTVDTPTGSRGLALSTIDLQFLEFSMIQHSQKVLDRLETVTGSRSWDKYVTECILTPEGVEIDQHEHGNEVYIHKKMRK